MKIGGTFIYKIDDWKSAVNKSTKGTHANVIIKQPAARAGVAERNTLKISILTIAYRPL
jgi:hypothetical protein